MFDIINNTVNLTLKTHTSADSVQSIFNTLRYEINVEATTMLQNAWSCGKLNNYCTISLCTHSLGKINLLNAGTYLSAYGTVAL